MKRAAARLGFAAALGIACLAPGLAQEVPAEAPGGMEDGAFDLALPPEEDLGAGPDAATIPPRPISPESPSPDEPTFEEDGFSPGADPGESFLEVDGDTVPEIPEPPPEPAEPASAPPEGEGAPETDGVEPPPEASAPTAAPPAENPFFSFTLESLEATRSAPLFTPSRTAPAVEAPPEAEPTPAEPEPAPEPVATPPQLQLIGVVVAGDEEVAILSDQASGEVLRLRPGEEHQGWTLKILDGQSVEFIQGEERQKLTMFTDFPDPPPQPDRQTDPEYSGSEDPAFENGTEGAMEEQMYDENGEPIDPRSHR